MPRFTVSIFQGVTDSAAETVRAWASGPAYDLLFDLDRDQINRYMKAFDQLHQSRNKKEFSQLMATAMARLKREVSKVLRMEAKRWRPVTDSNACQWQWHGQKIFSMWYEEYTAPERPDVDVIIYLRNIAKIMNYSGEIGYCVDAYKRFRKRSLRAQLKQMHFRELSIATAQGLRRYTLDELKLKIELWVQVSKICVKILFLREKQLCHSIFEGIDNLDSAKDECFVGIVQDFAVKLFAFVETMSLSYHPVDRMTILLALYDTFVWVLPDAQSLFDSNPGNVIRNACFNILSSIENQVGKMLYDFENSVLRDQIKDVSGNSVAVDQSTKDVMSNISVIAERKNSLVRLIKSSPSLVFGDFSLSQDVVGDYFSNHSCFLERHIILIIVVLQLNLEKKSRFYNNPTLSQLFMMNSVIYIAQKIQESNELKVIISHSYFKRLNENKFLDCFQNRGLYILPRFKFWPLKNVVRKRLNAFNAAFEEIKDMHSKWTISNVQLKYQICGFMYQKLVPAYRNFLEIVSNGHETKLLLDKSIKYSLADFEALLGSLFPVNSYYELNSP